MHTYLHYPMVEKKRLAVLIRLGDEATLAYSFFVAQGICIMKNVADKDLKVYATTRNLSHLATS